MLKCNCILLAKACSCVCDRALVCTKEEYGLDDLRQRTRWRGAARYCWRWSTFVAPQHVLPLVVQEDGSVISEGKRDKGIWTPWEQGC